MTFGPFDPNDKQHLDNLFNMTQRGAFSGYTPDQIAQESSSVDVAPGSVSEDERWPLYLQGYAFNRCYNNSFDAPPALGADTTLSEIDNKLPGWTFVDGTSDSSGVCTYRTGAQGQGHLEFTAGSGCSVNDEVYVEQLIYMPFASIRPFNFYASMKGFEAAAGLTMGTDIVQFIRVRWLYLDGTEYDNDETTYTKGDAEAGNCRQWWSYGPTSTTYAKVQIGYRVLSTTNLTDPGTAFGALYAADFSNPEYSYLTLQFSYGEAIAHETLSASTTYTMESQPKDVHEAAAKFRSVAPGFIMGMHTSTDASISSGKVNFRPVINGTGVDWTGDPNLTSPAHQLGHDVESRGTTDYLNYATQGKKLNADTAYDFLNGQSVQMEMVTDSSWNATAGCYSATLSLMLVWHEEGNATAGESLDSIAYRGG